MEIHLTHTLLEKAGKEGAWPFLLLFINAYKKAQGEEPTKEGMNQFNGWQNTLVAFSIFREEVRSGGFVQLVHNGYGPYIFDNPFARALREMGAIELSKLVYEAKKLFDARRNEMQQEVSEDELCETYIKFEEFDPLDDKYIDIEDEQTLAIAQFVDNHIDDFAIID